MNLSTFLFIMLVGASSFARTEGRLLCMSSDLCQDSLPVLSYLQFGLARVSARCSDAQSVSSNTSYDFDTRSFARTCYMSSTGDRSILFTELNN